ncbi:MAG: class I SAM-dependent methyltransferase [Candidatus Methylumidiphilus sp.]
MTRGKHGALKRELFKPIAVQNPLDHPWLFKLRCVVDLQLSTISKYLRPAILNIHGSVLDVGAGQSPWRGWLPRDTRYQGIDVKNAGEFGMTEGLRDVVYYDGNLMPFSDSSFDNVICVEVLEHASNPQLLISEIARVLKHEGNVFLTVPWSARRHHIPHDFHRFTRERLATLFSENGFSQIEIKERGSDVSVIANKLIVLNHRLLTPKSFASSMGMLALGVFCLPITGAFLALAHASEYFAFGATEDPLGYFVKAIRVR